MDRFDAPRSGVYQITLPPAGASAGTVSRWFLSGQRSRLYTDHDEFRVRSVRAAMVWVDEFTGGVVIRLAGVSKSYSGRAAPVDALRDIDLDVGAGEFVAVVGRSGCGKSTLLRLVAGLVAPSAGQISIDGSAVGRPRRDVAMVFQRPALLPWRSVLGNVLLPVEMFGLRRDEYLSHGLALLKTFGLDGFRDRLPHELSGGMQQRVSLCRALLVRPRVMLMDEPFAALDAITREEMAVEFQRVHREHAATVVFVTHSIHEAVLLADRVVVLTERPGSIRKILDVDIPRPRDFGHSAHLADVAEVTAELHDLL